MFDDVFLVVAALAGRDGIYAQFVQLDGVILANSEPAGSALSVSNHEIDGMFLAQLWEELLHDPDT